MALTPGVSHCGTVLLKFFCSLHRQHPCTCGVLAVSLQRCFIESLSSVETLKLTSLAKSLISLDCTQKVTGLERNKKRCEGFLHYDIYCHDVGLFRQFGVTVIRGRGECSSYTNIPHNQLYYVHAGLSLYHINFMYDLSWIQYFSIPHYGFSALQHNEFLGQNFCPEHKTAEISRCQGYVICTTEEYLANQGIDISSWGFWKNYVALGCIMIIFLSITYVQLLSLKKKRYF
ncbi:ATP-binding cassette sub-family G member 3 [Cricetulus griseus]|uniref:ATP-binding cassette sub-family G member 3 n=1 Tax=Cricetulus griseus TaxID=10029 RepID=G3IMH1_CRIGR|nr:ATP-binding cassette sub-family G member 3 [Cricetulus griseus]